MKKAKKDMLIGELSSRTGVTKRTIQFYIQEGLLPEPVRPHKNIAYYDETFIEMIAAIKKAQAQRYLPLVVIRKILEENKFDYSSLVRVPGGKGANQFDGSETGPEMETVLAGDYQEEVIRELAACKWIKTDSRGKKGVFPQDEAELIQLISRFNRNGIPLKSVIKPFKDIEDVIKEMVEVELNYLLGWALENKPGSFNQLWQLEKKSILSFVQRVWEKQREKAIARRMKVWDNMYLATTDEGFGIPAEEIRTDLDRLEASIPNRASRVQGLMDLATGYSIIGDLDRARRIHGRAFKLKSHDREVRTRMLWYRRFSKRPGELNRLRKEAQEIVDSHPDYALGHAFLALWHTLGLRSIDDHQEILRTINRSLEELNRADELEPSNEHDWVLINYIQGRTFTEFLGFGEYLDRGIQAFEKILKKKADLNWYYTGRMPFFSKWLWPNLYFFLGSSYLTAGRLAKANDILSQASDYIMMPPFHKKLEALVESVKVKMSGNRIGGDDD